MTTFDRTRIRQLLQREYEERMFGTLRLPGPARHAGAPRLQDHTEKGSSDRAGVSFSIELTWTESGPVLGAKSGKLIDVKVVPIGNEQNVAAQSNGANGEQKSRRFLVTVPQTAERNEESPRVVGGDLEINYETGEVFRAGDRIRLTPIEFKLLSELARNMGRVVPKARLMEAVWGAEYKTATSYLKPHIHNLRRKFGDDDESPRIIVNERGFGYRLVYSEEVVEESTEQKPAV